jgi:MFS family permease
MTNPIHILLLVALVFGYVLPALLVGRLAERRGRSFTVYLVASLIVGWVIPLIAVLIFSNRRHADHPPV